MLLHRAVLAFICVLFAATSAVCQSAETVATALDHFRSGRFEQAYTAYSALLPGCTDCGPIHAGVVRSLLRQEKIKESGTAADAALVALPKDAAVQTAIGELRFRQGDLEAADRAFVAAANSNRRTRAHFSVFPTSTRPSPSTRLPRG
jgi:hypothetical protein